jgi:toxin-antitoxin system PIN domain toxin
MTRFLPDVNVLIALMWPAHESHSQVQDWFARQVRQGWATCPFTQAAFVRLVSNPEFSRDAVTPQEAINLLSANLKYHYHRFWSLDEFHVFLQAFAPIRRSVRNSQLHPLEAKFDVLFDIISRAVGRDSRFRFPAQQLEETHTPALTE